VTQRRVLFLCTHNSARSQMAEGFLRAMAGDRFEAASVVCDDANERCPFVPGTVKRLHWSFEDPSRAQGSEEHRLEVFRSVRDQVAAGIADWIETS